MKSSTRYMVQIMKQIALLCAINVPMLAVACGMHEDCIGGGGCRQLARCVVSDGGVGYKVLWALRILERLTPEFIGLQPD
jgi:hypothetical protein